MPARTTRGRFVAALTVALCWALMPLWANTARADFSLALSARTPTLEVFNAGSRTLRPEQALNDPSLHWLPSANAASPGITEASIWLRFAIAPGDTARVMTIANPLLSRLNVYIGDAGRIRGHMRFGNSLPFGARPFRSDPDFTMAIPASARPLLILVEATSVGTIWVAPQLRTPEQYRAGVAHTALLRGLCYGTLFVMVFFNIGLSFALGDRADAYYVGYGVATLFMVLALDGTGFQYLWPTTTSWQASSVLVFVGLVMAFQQLFARDFLRVSPLSLLHSSMTVVAVLCFLQSLSTFLYLGATSYWVLLTLGALSNITLLVAGIQSWRSGYPPARMYCIAYAFLLGGSTVFMLRYFGVVTDGFFVRHGLHFGSTVHVALLALAIGVRIKIERAERESARADADSLSLRLDDLQREREAALTDRNLQDSLQRARQLQVLGQMASGFGHGFNNLLTSMMGFAELAIDRTREGRDDTLRRFLTEIQSGGRRAAELVDQLLTYSGSNRREATEVSLSTVTERALAILRPTLGTRHKLLWTPPEQSPTARVDPDRLQQAIINLCLNARDAMPEHGTIELRILQSEFTNETCASCLTEISGSWNVIQVSDHGAGIEGDIAAIFTPFHTTRPGDGGGLGLAVVHGVAHEYSGHVVVRSGAEGGSQFNLCLPA